MLSLWGTGGIKPRPSACFDKYDYSNNTGICTVVDVNNTNDVEWMKTCKLFGKRDYVFMYKGIVEKYRFDMAVLHDTYEQLKLFAAQLSALTKDVVVLPVDEGLPSLVDMAVYQCLCRAQRRACP